MSSLRSSLKSWKTFGIPWRSLTRAAGWTGAIGRRIRLSSAFSGMIPTASLRSIIPGPNSLTSARSWCLSFFPSLFKVLTSMKTRLHGLSAILVAIPGTPPELLIFVAFFWCRTCLPEGLLAEILPPLHQRDVRRFTLHTVLACGPTLRPEIRWPDKQEKDRIVERCRDMIDTRFIPAYTVVDG